MKKLSGWLMVCFVMIGLASAAFAGIAEDTADNYSGVWGDETSGGYGFGPWQFTSNDDGDTLFAGGFIGDPGNAGIDMDDPAFGLYANPAGASISIDRIFVGEDEFGDPSEDPRPLELGNVFSLEWGVNFDSGDGNKGFSLFADGVELVNVNQGGFPGDITVNGVDAGLAYGVNPMLWSFRMAGPNSLEVTATSRENFLEPAFSTTVAVSAAPDRFRIYASGMTGDEMLNREPYFNNFEIITGTPPQLYFIAGESSVDEEGDYDFVLGRLPGGAVTDTILLSSSNTDALTVPASIDFDDEEDELTFQAEVISLTEGNATITASNTASGASATFSVTIIAPTLSISGPGSVLVGQSVEYTVTRTGPIPDAITVASDDTDVLDLPETSLTFDAESSTVTFMADAFMEGVAELTATDGVVSSPAFVVTVVDIPPPPVGIYDDGTFYPTGWDDGSNGGNGFEAWEFNHTQGEGFAGVFMGNPADAAIDGMADRAFGFYANPPGSGANAEVNRALSDPMEVGQVFRFLWGLNWDSNNEGSNRGFNLYAGETQLLNFNMGNSEVITVNGNTMFEVYGSEAMLIQIQYVADGLVRVWATGRDGIEEYDQLLALDSGAPDNFRFYFNATDSAADQRQMYFDQLEVIDGDPVDALVITGPTSVPDGTTPTYTVTRTGNVGDAVNLASSDTGVMTVPISITFPVDGNVQTFEAEAVGVGVTELTATAGMVSSAPLSVTVTFVPEPPEGIYDDATFYPEGWSDGTNGGNGFEPWAISATDGGTFIGDASVQGANNAAINTEGVAFGMWTDGGEDERSVNASRAFTSPLNVGDVFTFQLAFRWDNGTRGFTLNDANGEVFYLGIDAGGYFWSGEGASDPTPWDDGEEENPNPIREAGVVLDVEVTQLAGSIAVSITSDQDPTLDAGGTFSSGALTSFSLYLSDAGGDPDGNFYANRFEVEASTEPALLISGPTTVVVGTQPTYTVTRFNIAENVIDLTTQNNTVMEVPLTVTFDPGSPTATFQGDALTVGSTTLWASDGDLAVESNYLEVNVVAAPEPPEGIYDDATFYDGSWNNEDNGGAGFEPWNIWNTDGGTFIGDASEQGPNNAAINTDGVAFGMWTMGGEEARSVDAERSFSTPLSVGDVFTFQLAFKWDNGTRGFTLNDAEDEVFFFGIDADGYFWSGDGAAPGTPWQDAEENPIREAGVVLDVEVTQLDGEISVSVTSAQDPALNASGTVPSGALTTFKLYLSNAGGDTDGNFYANRFEVTAGDPPGPEGPVVDSFGFVAGQAQVTIMGEAGKSYYLVYTTDLTTITSVNPPVLTEWEVADAEVSLGADGEVTLTDADPGDEARFYGVLITETPLP